MWSSLRTSPLGILFFTGNVFLPIFCHKSHLDFLLRKNKSKDYYRDKVSFIIKIKLWLNVQKTLKRCREKRGINYNLYFLAVLFTTGLNYSCWYLIRLARSIFLLVSSINESILLYYLHIHIALVFLIIKNWFALQKMAISFKILLCLCK